MLRIEDSVSVCFFNIAIFPISFSNAKMDVDIIGKLINTRILFRCKNLFGLFSRKAETSWSRKINVLHFEFHCQKLLRLYHNTYIHLFYIDLSTKPYQGLWFNWTHLLLFPNMSVKIYSTFFLIFRRLQLKD